MFTKVLSTISLALALSIQVNGHTLMTPALGVQGAGARSDVQRLARTGGCGKMDVASTIDTSTPVAAAADGTFTVTATNFNRLRDGSRQLTATMDSTGSGDNFNGAVSVTQNGDNRPKSLGSEQIVAAIPAGTTCTGGAAGNLCLVSFQNGAIQGFGNCVVVSQGAAAASDAGTAATGASAAGTADTATASGASAAGTANAATGASAAGTADTATASGASAAGTANAGTESSAANAGTASTGAGSSADGVSNAGTESSAAGVSNTGAVSSTANGATSGASSGVSAGSASTGSASGAGVASSGQALNQAGTRAARALLAELEARGEDMDLIKRGLVDWVRA